VSSSDQLRATTGDARPLVAEVYMAVFPIDGGEQVFTAVTPQGVRLPVVALDKNDLGVLKKYAQNIADETGETVSIICFTARQLYESFRPSATGD